MKENITTIKNSTLINKNKLISRPQTTSINNNNNNNNNNTLYPLKEKQNNSNNNSNNSYNNFNNSNNNNNKGGGRAITLPSNHLNVNNNNNNYNNNNGSMNTERCFVSTSSTMFFENDGNNNGNFGKMVVIPISPMYSDVKQPITWDSEFFGRGATSLPGARSEVRNNDNSLPGLNTSRSNKNHTRQLFSRQATANVSSSSLLSTSTSTSVASSASPSPTTFIDLQDVSPRSHPTNNTNVEQRSGINSSPILLSPSPISNGEDHIKLKEHEIEPWAFKIISKYQTDSTRRPQSRCTTRLRGDGESIIGPPLNLGEMVQSRSCPVITRTGKLAALP